MRRSVKTGRPSKLTPEVQDAIVRAIRIGSYIEIASEAAGICKDTLYEWLKQARKPNASKTLREFSDAIRKALAESELLDLARIAEASKREWTAAAWRLERRAPDRWGRKDRHAIEGVKNGEPIRYVLAWKKSPSK